MRRIRYQVACSLDGYIAGPQGQTDWIVDEPTIDFGALFDQFDTLLMGRATYVDLLPRATGFWGKRVFVFSRTLRQEDHPEVTVVAEDGVQRIGAMREEAGKDIWLFGGGELFRLLLQHGCVDTVEPAIIPVLLGGGRPLLTSPAVRSRLSLTGHRVYPSGIVWLEYSINHA
ncbi:MAG TPA: dihydrofolate reductase family protein [Vicinamibacterales bacterium]|nr:dihydrofolate reductase family protein [Vicinamibacterales bacterium]